MMSNAAKYAAYGLGGATLVAGSFFLFTALSGTPVNETKLVGQLFPDNPEAQVETENPDPRIEEQLELDTRSPEQIFDGAASPLAAFQLPPPISAQELGALEARLLHREEQLDKRSAALDAREELLEKDAARLAQLQDEIALIQAQIITESQDTKFQADETAARDAANRARAEETYKRMAVIFENGEAAQVADQITSWYTPTDGGKVLKHLAEDRVAEILTAIQEVDSDLAKSFATAYGLEVASR